MDEMSAAGPPRRLNLGCGLKKRPDCLNVDVRPAVEPDLVWDLEKRPYPLPRDHFERIWALDVVESLGRESVPVLEQLLAKFRRADEKKGLDSALKIAVTLGDAPAAPQKKKGAEPAAAAGASGLPASLVDPFAAAAEAKKGE